MAADKEKKVEAVLVNFGLSDTKDVMVGSPEGPIRGISGSKRSRDLLKHVPKRGTGNFNCVIDSRQTLTLTSDPNHIQNLYPVLC